MSRQNFRPNRNQSNNQGQNEMGNDDSDMQEGVDDAKQAQEESPIAQEPLVQEAPVQEPVVELKLQPEEGPEATAPETEEAPKPIQSLGEYPKTSWLSELRYTPEVLALSNRVIETGDVQAIAVLQAFDVFGFNMNRDRIITGPEAATEQVQIFRAIQQLINGLGESFPITLATVLKIIDDTGEYGVFSGASVFRYGDFSRLSMDDRTSYIDIWNALHVIAPSAGRKDALKYVDLQALRSNGRQAFSEQGVRRLIAFLSN